MRLLAVDNLWLYLGVGEDIAECFLAMGVDTDQSGGFRLVHSPLSHIRVAR